MSALAPAGAHAASLHIADAAVTVAQGASAPFEIHLSASGALTCRTDATVSVDSIYSVHPSGVTSDGPVDATFFGAGGRGSSSNCDASWDGAPDPFALSAIASATADTPLGDYRAAIAYTVYNAPRSGPAGKLSSAGTVPVTIHVVTAAPEAPVAPAVTVTTTPPASPPVTLPPEAQEVLGVRTVAPGPHFGKSELLRLVSGKVIYRTPRGRALGLGDDAVVPNGTVVDTSHGVVKITVEHDAGGALNSANAWGGGFQSSQDNGGITTFTLADTLGSQGAARAAHTSRTTRTTRTTKKKRVLWVNGKGNFKTRGKRASAIARGTTWKTEDTGAVTRVTVKNGAVAVRDLVKRRTVLVKAGHSYTARQRRAVARRVPAFTGRDR